MAEHLDPMSVSRYLSGAGTPSERVTWESHLAECAECREELVAVGRILAAPPTRRWVRVIPAAAAAAILLAWIGTVTLKPSPSITRDPDSSPSTALAPRPLAPLGDVSRPGRLVWSAVPGATRYRVTLFTADGQAAWQASGADTVAALPDSVRLPVSTAQYWQVKAETGYGRWIESELVAFTIRAEGPSR